MREEVFATVEKRAQDAISGIVSSYATRRGNLVARNWKPTAMHIAQSKHGFGSLDNLRMQIDLKTDALAYNEERLITFKKVKEKLDTDPQEYVRFIEHEIENKKLKKGLETLKTLKKRLEKLKQILKTSIGWSIKLWSLKSTHSRDGKQARME